MIRKLLQWLYPNRCLFCREILPAEHEPLCPACAVRELSGAGMQVTLSSGLPVITALRYQGLSRRLLLRYKFRGQANLCRPIARLMAQALNEQAADACFDCITWVPTGFWRLTRRGYDQSGLLARELSRLLGVPCRRLLVKRRLNRRQSSLTYDERAANVRGVYRLKGTLPPGLSHILLVDDVITSGSTISSAAEVLRSEGRRVTGLCLENAMHRNSSD